MLGFWKTTTPWRFKRLVFRSKVYAAIIDGLETYELSELEVGRMNRCLMQYLRPLCGREGKLWDSKREIYRWRPVGWLLTWAGFAEV
eukprot:9292091-Lingulodinium_polyedra.AAC.1